MSFIDEVTINIKAGDGGNGCVSFHRAKFVEFGGPDGGNGGHGGSIFIVSDSSLNTLSHFKRNRYFKAQNGSSGSGKNKSGKSGEDLFIKVPVGTQILSQNAEFLLWDFCHDGEIFEIIHGGKGGLGNHHFKSSINRAPRRRTEGEIGAEMDIVLKLKLLSDIGVIGLPNAGKSTFVSQTTAAKPRIGDYAFTTLIPSLGVACVDDIEFVIADIPGLIEGAHLGRGLGDKFLKHIERCKVLIHLVSSDSKDIVRDYLTIRHELESYGGDITTKPEIVCISKCDLSSDKELELQIGLLQAVMHGKIFTISAYDKPKLLQVLRVAYSFLINL